MAFKIIRTRYSLIAMSSAESLGMPISLTRRAVGDSICAKVVE